MKTIRCLFVCYFIVVLVFALLNWCAFLHNTTSFSISEQLNKHVGRYDLLNDSLSLASFDMDSSSFFPISVNGFADLIRPEFLLLDSINGNIRHAKDSLNDLQSELEDLNYLAGNRRDSAIRLFRILQLREEQLRIDSLKSFISDHDSTEMVLNGEFVELANMEVAYAKKNVEISSYITENFGRFIPEQLLDSIRVLNEKYFSLSSYIFDYELRRREVASRIRQSTDMFHENRVNSISFWDFLYYSICVGTTVHFGDIAPNNGITRTFAAVEILLCLLVVGLIINSLYTAIKDNERHESK